MTSYSAMAARGRAAALERAGEPFRKIVEFRVTEINRRANVVGIDGRPVSLYVQRRGEYVGECGHILKFASAFEPDYLRQVMIGRRKRCSQCPKIVPKPVPEDHCLYEWETEWGDVKTCGTRGRYASEEYELLCLKHARLLLDMMGDAFHKREV